jgi:DNA primase
MGHDGHRGAPRKQFSFDRSRLPFGPDQIVAYYAGEGVKLSAHGEWRDAICLFHDDTKPSFRVRASTGAYRCMVCGAHGAGPLDFHMARHALSFIEAARALGAWIEIDRRPAPFPPSRIERTTERVGQAFQEAARAFRRGGAR